MEKSEKQPPYNPQIYPTLPPSSTSIDVGSIPSTSTSTTAATVVTGVPVQPVQYGPYNQNTVCPHCQNQVLTRVEAETSSKTHLTAVFLCVCLFWPCVCVPYCVDSCKTKNHYCPQCGAYLGTYDS